MFAIAQDHLQSMGIGEPPAVPDLGRLDAARGYPQVPERGQLCVTLPHHIGSRVELHEMDRAQLAACIEFLRDVEVPQP